MNDVTGIILAGGKSSRMGTEKGLVHLGGKPMISHVIETLEKLGLKRILICANDNRYEQFKYPITKDVVIDKGPMGGIYSALIKSRTENNLVVSCDIPNITVEILEYLLSNTNGELATITSHQKNTHPLIGIYTTKSLPIIKKCLENEELKMTDLCKKLNAKIVEIPVNVGSDTHFLNINSLHEIEDSKVMNIQVNYFGRIAESVDKNSEVISISSDFMPLNLRRFFEEKYPNLKNDNYKIAVNQEFTEEIVSNKCINEIALLPPFAGG